MCGGASETHLTSKGALFPLVKTKTDRFSGELKDSSRSIMGLNKNRDAIFFRKSEV